MTDSARTAVAASAGHRRAAALSAVVADPDPLARAALVDALGKSWLPVIAEVQTLAEAVDAARRLSPRLMILAAAFPGLASTREAIREMHKQAPETAVVITELPNANQDPVTAFRAGAAGYVIKDAEIVRWLGPMLNRYARAGVTPLTPGIAYRVVRGLQEGRTVGGPDTATTPSDRELEVLCLVGRGLRNQQIALALSIGISTVKSHVHNLLRNLQLSNRVQLALYANDASRRD